MDDTRGVLCFGEMLLRLSAPGRSHLLQEARLDAHIGGAEANVAVALARIGVRSRLVTALPDDALGDAALESIRASGVDVSSVLRAPGRLGVYYLTHGAGVRTAEVLYDRQDSLFARTPASAYDWPALLKGARWLHLSGIIPAIGPGAAEVSLAAMRAARATGIRISFDGNFRASMWARWSAEPGPILAEHVAMADLLIGNRRDIALLLGKDVSEDPREAALTAFSAFPNLSIIASTWRTMLDPENGRLGARIDTRAAAHALDEIALFGIVDRIGSGDAFAAGVLAGIDEGPQVAVRLGLQLAALKHGTPGDQSRTSRRELDAFDPTKVDVRR